MGSTPIVSTIVSHEAKEFEGRFVPWRSFQYDAKIGLKTLKEIKKSAGNLVRGIVLKLGTSSLKNPLLQVMIVGIPLLLKVLTTAFLLVLFYIWVSCLYLKQVLPKAPTTSLCYGLKDQYFFELSTHIFVSS